MWSTSLRCPAQQLSLLAWSESAAVVVLDDVAPALLPVAA